MKGLTRQIALAIGGPFMVFSLSFLSTNFSSVEGTQPDTNGSTYYELFLTSVTPAPFSFAVWFPIFVGVLAFSFYQALPAHRKDAQLDKLAWPALAAYILNASTGVVSLPVSVPIILALLVSLILIFRILAQDKPATRTFIWLVRLPFTLFFSWVVVATILTVSQYLVSIGWSGWGISADAWGALLVLFAATLGFIIVRRSGVPSFALPLIWGFIGIIVVNAGSAVVVTACVIGAALLAAGLTAQIRAIALSQVG